MLWSSLLRTGLKMFLELYQQKADSRRKWEAFFLSSFAHTRDRMKYQWLQVQLLIFISRGMEMMGWSPHSGTKQHLWISPFIPRIQSHILVDSGRYWSFLLQKRKGIRSPDIFHDFWMLRIWNKCNNNALGMFTLVSISASFYCFLLVLPFSVWLQERQHLRSGCTVPVTLSYTDLVHILVFCFNKNDIITEKIPRDT